MGYNVVFDQINQINLSLPQQYRIFIRTDKVWIGGKEDGSTYLHIERILAQALELNRPLADGDLDIQVYPSGLGEEMDNGIMAQDISCRLRGEDLNGLWFRVTFSEQHHYLVLLAARGEAQYPELKDAAFEIAQMIKTQAPKPENALVAVAA